MTSPTIVFLELLLVVISVVFFFKSAAGKKIENVLPTPFWIYLIPIVLSSFGILPQQSVVYSNLRLHVLPVALILMLIGIPVSLLRKLGSQALVAMILGMISMFVAALALFLVFVRFMPPEGGKMVGALLGTWIGGSANMLAVKEILNLSDAAMGPVVLADTFLSYGWMALLILSVTTESWFDRKLKSADSLPVNQDFGAIKSLNHSFKAVLITLSCGFLIGEVLVFIGQTLSSALPFLSASAWTLLLASTAGINLSLTPLQRLESFGASKVGGFLLYLVLASIGANTTLQVAWEGKIFILFSMGLLIVHGLLMLVGGRLFRVPYFLLATASQANIGGAVSAPVVASVFRPSAAPIGVLMAVLGAVAGTYLGALGGSACQAIQNWIQK